MTQKRKIWLFLYMFAVFCSAVAVSAATAPVNVIVAVAQGRSVGEYVYASGVIIKGEPLIQTSKTDLAVSDICVRVGDYIRSGDVIMKTVDGSKITAEYDGTVSEIFDISSGVAAGQNLISYIDTDTLSAAVNVAESDISKIKKGQTVSITGSGFKGREYKGKIETIGAEAQSAQNAAVFVTVGISLDEPDNNLKPNFTVKARISVGSDDNAVTVPQSAVASDSSGEYVYVVNGSSADRRSVKTKCTGSEIYIKSGLNIGEKVIKDINSVQNKADTLSVSVGAVQ